ncbi:MAG: hypothetical protein ACTSWP_08200 [Candidatus Freyarchaeota archaeon]|nr:hypothetical protein [Candidatus Freyrarchaeum guaymaensis]
MRRTRDIFSREEEWRKEDEAEREVRRKHADWAFIEAQPSRVKAALKLYVETGDLRLAQRIAGMGLEEFIETLLNAKIPRVTFI